MQPKTLAVLTLDLLLKSGGISNIFAERKTRLTLHNDNCDTQTNDDTNRLDHQNTEATMQTIGDRLDQLEAKLDEILEILSADVVFEMDERDLH